MCSTRSSSAGSPTPSPTTDPAPRSGHRGPTAAAPRTADAIPSAAAQDRPLRTRGRTWSSEPLRFPGTVRRTVEGMRDRDTSGRPRNARPRDAYGRPLPHGASGIPTMPEDLDLPPKEALAEAQRLLDADRPFHAHEVLEAVWKASPEPERELWRALAQVAVGITHMRRGNARGAKALLSRAAERLVPYEAAPPHDIDVQGIIERSRELADRPENGPVSIRLSAASPDPDTAAQ